MSAAAISGDASEFTRRFGLRLQATRSRPPKNWWSRKWQEYMESLQMGARIGRGRQYATGGNVRSLSVSAGRAVASVAGGGPAPYRCEILCESVGGEARKSLAGELRSRPMLLARLLAGEIAEEVDLRFKIAGCPLVPSAAAPLEARCSCPDPAPFCKHAAATLFLLGELFDCRPLALLEMRGIAEQDLFGGMAPGGQASQATGECVPGQDAGAQNPGAGGRAAPDAETPPFIDGLFEFPGQMPLWRGESRFADSVQECAARAAMAAKRMLDGELPRRRLR